MALATHGGVGLAGAGGVGAFMRWMQGREALNVATQLALMSQKIDQLMAQSEKHETMAERLALVEQKAAAAHSRIDDLQSRRRSGK